MSGAVPDEPAVPGGEFRPDLEGLRAVAVGLVLAYHAGVPRVHGGYVGVDVFFVLSGFLITGLIVREVRATGGLDLPRFYARRARRLLPAAAVALIGTLVLSAMLLPPLQLPDVAGDAAAASLYVSNLRFAFQATDYLASDLAPSPLLHFWSLGVEEQFYVFWPALLLVAATIGGKLTRGGDAGLTRRLGTVVVAVAIASFAASLVLTTAAQPWAFFSLPTRAWELALGAALALSAAQLARIPAIAGGALVALGLILVATAGLVLEQSTPFPGTAALLPTVGAALVIAGGAAGAGTLPARLLALRPMRFLGRISYSLYLWHWPILVLPAAVIDGTVPLPARLALAGVSIVVATASQRWVEDPIRHGRLGSRRIGRTLALAGATSVLVALLAVGIGGAASASLPPSVAHASDDPSALPPDPLGTSSLPRDPSDGPLGSSRPAGPSSRPSAAPNPFVRPPTLAAPVPPDLTPPLAQVRSDAPTIYADGCHVDQASTEPKPCVFGDRSSSASIALFGDSHAAQWFPALDRLARVEGWKLISFTKSACTPADLTVWSSTFERAFSECDAWRERVFSALAELRPTVVLMAMSRGYVLVDGASTATVAERQDLWDSGIAASLVRLSAIAEHVVLMGDTPRSRADPAACLSRNLGNSLVCATKTASALDPTRTAADARLADAAGAIFIDPAPWVCPTDPCPAVIGRYLVFRDSHHLTTAFSIALSRRILDALPALPRRGP